jgi:hypothetical protein
MYCNQEDVSILSERNTPVSVKSETPSTGTRPEFHGH